MPDPMTPDLDAIRERLAAATPGPWLAYDPNEGDPGPLWCVANDAFHNPLQHADGAPYIDVQVLTGRRADAEFIAAAPTDVAALMAWGEHLAAEVERQARMIRYLRRTMRTYDATLADARSETPDGGEGGE